jgi:hypothetical protein
VDQDQLQVLQIAVVSILFLILIVSLSRKGRLSFRYSLGWFAVFAIAALGGVLVPIVDPIASLLRVSVLAVVVGVVVCLLLLICIQLSISISGLQRQLRSLAEDIALRTVKESDELHTS